MSSLENWLKEGSSNRAFEVNLSNVRIVHSVTIDENGDNSCSKHVRASGTFKEPLFTDDILVDDSRSIWHLPINLSIDFRDVAEFQKLTKAIGYMRFWEAMKGDGIFTDKSDSVSLHVLLPESFADRFAVGLHPPMATIQLTGFEGKHGPVPGLGKYKWESSNPLLLTHFSVADVLQESDPETPMRVIFDPAESAKIQDIQATLRSIEGTIRWIQENAPKFVGWVLGMLGGIIIAIWFSRR